MSLPAALTDWAVGVAVIDATGPRCTLGALDEVVPLASVTKLIVAAAMTVAVEERAVDLDAPAGPPGSTLRHLLAHASGLAPDDDRVLAPPGTRRIYSNQGFVHIGATLEAATAMPWARYVHDATLAPLGMGHTQLGSSPARGATGTVGDLAKLARELLAPTLVHPSTLAEATRPQFPDLDGVLPGVGSMRPNPWGLGFEVRGHKSPHWTGTRNSPRTFGHFGASGTFVWADPDSGIAAVGLGRRDFGAWALEVWPRRSDAILDGC